jgi:hypothetical protein
VIARLAAGPARQRSGTVPPFTYQPGLACRIRRVADWTAAWPEWARFVDRLLPA